ncbi:MAG TPA: ABC transporter substrate-binding protein [Candidatus Eisenbacteria bacterium]|nr:ABC transporter substrate-binding protein [Candidatus Eisenbacteria bacterium]
MPTADRRSVAGRAARAALAALAAVAALALGDSRAMGAGTAAPAMNAGKRFPLGRPGELKARLLAEPSSPLAPAWALEYTGLLEIDRLDPPARAAERLWAARAGLAAAGAKAPERKRLQAIATSLETAPLDSIPIKRAAQGLTRIGVVVPLSGRYERYGKTFVNGMRLAAEEHNREWEPSLRLILHDSEGDPLVGAKKARWLLKDHGVSILVGELFTANTAPLAAATQVIGALLLSPSATNERLATLGDGIFQLHLGSAAAAGALASHLAALHPKSTAALLVAPTPEDSSRALVVAAALGKAGIGIVGIERIPEGTADATKAIAALKGKRPASLVLLAPARTVGVVAPQLPSTWPGVHVYGFDELDPEGLNREARDALEGATLFLSDYALAGAVRDSFEVRYQRANGEPPTRMAVRGYLAGLAIARGIEGGAATTSMLREALRTQVYETDEGRVLRSLRPVVPAFAERLVVRAGHAVDPKRP